MKNKKPRRVSLTAIMVILMIPKTIYPGNQLEAFR